MVAGHNPSAAAERTVAQMSPPPSTSAPAPATRPHGGRAHPVPLPAEDFDLLPGEKLLTVYAARYEDEVRDARGAFGDTGLSTNRSSGVSLSAILRGGGTVDDVFPVGQKRQEEDDVDPRVRRQEEREDVVEHYYRLRSLCGFVYKSVLSSNFM